MGTRASYYFGVMSVAWAALSFFQLIPYNIRYSVPLSSALVVIVSGLIVGVVSGAAVSLRRLRVLAAKGETRVSLVTWLFILGAAFIFIGASLLMAGESVEKLLIVSNFMYPIGIAALAASALLFFNWEQKHKRVILFASLVSSKLYIFPKIDSNVVQ